MRWKFIIRQDLGYGEVDTVIEDPIGWSEAVFQFNRDREWHGIFFQYSASLKFYNEAYDLIAAEYALNGVDGEMRLLIQFACSDTDEFEDFYFSKINFSKIQFENSDVCLVNVPIEDDTALTLFKNRIDQKVDLASLESLDGEELVDYGLPFNIPLAPKTFIITTNEDHSIAEEIDNTNSAPIPYTGIPPSDSFEVVLARYYQIGFDNVILNDSGTLDNEFASRIFLSDVNPLYVLNPTDRLGDYEVTVSMINMQAYFGGSGPDVYLADMVTLAGVTNYTIDVNLEVTQSGSPTTISLLSVDQTLDYPPKTTCDPPDSTSFPINIFYQNTFTLAPGDSIRLYVFLSCKAEPIHTSDPGGSTFDLCQRLKFLENDEVDHPNYFTVTLATNNGTTLCDVVLVNEALSRTAEAVTNDQLRVYSEYFGRTDAQPYTSIADGDGSLEALTIGLKIRQKIAPLIWSFKELYDNLNHIHNIGMGLEDDDNYGRPADSKLLRVEKARYFYNDTDIFNLPKIPSITRKVLSEEHFSIIQVGYAKWEAEEYNGLDEFATKREYRTTLKTVKNTLTKISNFIASGYAIEITKGIGRGSDDWRFDNDNFIICLLRSYGDFIVEQGNITSPANIIDPATVYNFRISPERNLLRWLMKVLASYVDPTTGELFFMDGEGNYIAEGMLPDSVEGSVLSESESPVGDDNMADVTEAHPVYIPEEWSFRYPMSVDQWHLVKANPNGVINVQYGQNSTFVRCYIRQIEYTPAKGEAQYTLLPKYPFELIVLGDFDRRDFEDIDFYTN